MRILGGYFFIYPQKEKVVMETYSKQPLSYSEQLDLLASRGLIIVDRVNAENFLKQVHYYRLSAYCLPFEAARHKFNPGATFVQIQQLYEFDRQLRSLIDEALEVIEVSFRSAFSYYLAQKYGLYAHEEPERFYSGFDHSGWVLKIHEEAERSKETFIIHYRSKYEGFPRLPIWIAVEVMSFGSLSMLYHNLLRNEQVGLAEMLGFHSKILSSWLHTSTYVRNICAHHSRLWNRELAIAMIVPKNIIWEGINAKRIGSVMFAIMSYLKGLPSASDIEGSWRDKMEGLILPAPAVSQFYKEIGLPEDFKVHPLWKKD
jgi:abortive infection bacteriophage resistance protein